MIMNFTIEERAFISSIQKTENGGKEVTQGRLACIREISFLMAQANTPEMQSFLNRTQKRLGWMTDQEYASFDFTVDDTTESSGEVTG